MKPYTADLEYDAHDAPVWLVAPLAALAAYVAVFAYPGWSGGEPIDGGRWVPYLPAAALLLLATLTRAVRSAAGSGREGVGWRLLTAGSALLLLGAASSQFLYMTVLASLAPPGTSVNDSWALFGPLFVGPLLAYGSWAAFAAPARGWGRLLVSLGKLLALFVVAVFLLGNLCRGGGVSEPYERAARKDRAEGPR